jgi:hypothetical protein
MVFSKKNYSPTCGKLKTITSNNGDCSPVKVY